MNTEKLNDWLQLAAAVGVLAGLLLVAYELRQQHELARAEMGSETFAARQELLSSLRDVATARAYAKAYESPASLTIEEHLILDSLCSETVTVTVGRHDHMIARGVFDPNLDRPARTAGRILFSSDYGRQWWNVRRDGVGPRVRDALDAVAADKFEPWFVDHATLNRESDHQDMEKSP